SPWDMPQVATETMGPNNAIQMLAYFDALYSRYWVESRITPDGTRQVKVPIGKMSAEIQKSIRSSQQQLANDIRVIEQRNTLIEQRNGPIVQVVSHFTGQKLKGFREDWMKWWTDERGYGYDPPPPRPKPTMTETIQPSYRPQQVEGFVYDQVAGYTPRPRTSCFSAGTLVRTKTGLQPIESLQVGDQVLTQDTATGALTYEPIITVFHNRPKPLLRIDLGSESILATGIHRFWQAGKGWTMARELKPGDMLRTLDGLVRVESVEPAPVQPVYNLEVARNASFFVGRQDALVHDNTLVQPTLQAFDAPMDKQAGKELAGE
ncbi:MAG TPA: Hint domain-containing protein, partial [Isosphaeraceae bacterium]|nr:Hint domain-containing protein [Isosphaeraceae bacterium]